MISFLFIWTNFCCCHWLNQTSKFSAQRKPYTAKEVVCQYQNHEFRCPCTSSLLPIHENWQLFWEILWKFANIGIWSAAWKLFYGVFGSQILYCILLPIFLLYIIANFMLYFVGKVSIKRICRRIKWWQNSTMLSPVSEQL